MKRNSKPSVLGELIKEEAASSNSVPKKGIREFKKRKGDDSMAKNGSPVSCAKKARTAKDSTNGLASCRYVRTQTAGIGPANTHQLTGKIIVLFSFFFFQNK